MRTVARKRATVVLLAWGFWALSSTLPSVWHPFGPYETEYECNTIRSGLAMTGTFQQIDECELDH